MTRIDDVLQAKVLDLLIRFGDDAVLRMTGVADQPIKIAPPTINQDYAETTVVSMTKTTVAAKGTLVQPKIGGKVIHESKHWTITSLKLIKSGQGYCAYGVGLER